MADFLIAVGATKPSLLDSLKANGIPLDITGATITFIGKSYGTTVISSPATVVDGPRGIVRYDPSTSDTAAAGTYACQWKVVYPNSGGTQFVPSDPIILEVGPA